MKFHRITKPLTALALCALLATAYHVTAAPSYAADSKKAAAETAKDAAKEKAKEDSQSEPADTAAATPDGENTGEAADAGAEAAADDDIMPPMATASKTEIPADLPSANDSKLAPDIKRMRTVDLGVSGSSDAYVPAGDAAGGETVPYVEPVGETHPVLNLTPDKSVIVRLDRPAGSVLVGNSAHVNVMIDTPTTLVVIPRMPGASYFTVLDEERRVLMKRHVVVGPAGQYVRVRRSCGNSNNCQHTSTFYCPDGMCHPIETQQRPGNPPEQLQASGARDIMGTTTSEGGEGEATPFNTEGGNGGPAFNFLTIPLPNFGFGGGGGGEEE